MSIKDVAKAVGVAPSTVSRVINGGNNSAASAETREKIWAAARDLGYMPNVNARALRRQEKISAEIKRIDCIFARVVGSNVDGFFECLLYAVRAQVASRGAQLCGIFTLQDMLTGEVIPANTNAAIVMGRVSSEQLELVRRSYQHVVCISLQDQDFPVDQVISRGYDAVLSAMAYLRELNHTRICYLGEVEAEQRFEAYLDAIADMEVTDPNSLIVDAAFSPASGYDAAKELLGRKKPFTAILCANDMMALGVMKALKEAHLHVPKDVSLVGINDKEDVRYLDPMLTAVNIPVEEMGRHAAMLILDRMDGGHKLPVKVILPNRLIPRESCRAIPASGR